MGSFKTSDLAQKKMGRKVRRSRGIKTNAFSLIEILVTFVLASILFGCIFSNFSQTTKLQQGIEEAHSRALNRQSMQVQLQFLLSQISLSVGDDGKKNSTPLYVADFPPERTKGLWFNLMVDYSDDQRFMGPLTYCLYHDEKNHALQLLVRNYHGEEKVERIMCDVEGWELSLFDPEKKVWQATWSESTNYLPPCIKLQIFEKGQEIQKEPIEFAFTLPAVSQTVVYSW